MQASIIAFDNFTDIDAFLLWDLLNRVKLRNWTVKILGDKDSHTSTTGIRIPMHGRLAEASTSDVVLFTSGQATRHLRTDQIFLSQFHLDPERQLIGSMCSGALLLAALGLLEGKSATTYPTVRKLLASYGVNVVERPFVREGNIATAAGCLAAQQLAGWVLEEKFGPECREQVLRSIQPVGEGLFYEDEESVQRVYAPAR